MKITYSNCAECLSANVCAFREANITLAQDIFSSYTGEREPSWVNQIHINCMHFHPNTMNTYSPQQQPIPRMMTPNTILGPMMQTENQTPQQPMQNPVQSKQ